MARFLTTIPNNLGFFNLGTVESYPTGGSGPTAYGPTSYFGSDPRPAEQGDNLNNPIDLGDFSSIFRSLEIKNTHGGLTRKQTTFYKLRLEKRRTIQFTQLNSQFSYEENTNRNTLLAFYQITEDGRREELPINDLGYVFREGAIDYEDEEGDLKTDDYPVLSLNPGQYLFLITNDIRYLETNYSIGLNVSSLDWRFTAESIDEALSFGGADSVTKTVEETLDFGSITL
tara:strand:- start:530 stop:1216 length:687 start_codon:yes stop_codon:yes gene_type:complete